MPRHRVTRTRVQRMGRSRARKETSRIVTTLKAAREDAGISQRALSTAAGLAPSAVWDVEDGEHEPTIEVLARIAAALGGELAVRFYPGSGALVRDHVQSAMVGALVAQRHPRWTASTEVWVEKPIRGVIDLLLVDGRTTVVCEAHSQLRRLEQQVRWLGAKAGSLVGGNPSVSPSTLLLLRNTAANRAVAIQFADYLAAAFPAHHHAAVTALTGTTPWPGAAVVWMEVTGGGARMLDEPPSGVMVGRQATGGR